MKAISFFTLRVVFNVLYGRWQLERAFRYVDLHIQLKDQRMTNTKFTSRGRDINQLPHKAASFL